MNQRFDALRTTVRTVNGTHVLNAAKDWHGIVVKNEMRRSPLREWLVLGAGFLALCAGFSAVFHLPESLRLFGVGAINVVGFAAFGWFRRRYMFQGACATKPKCEPDDR